MDRDVWSYRHGPDRLKSPVLVPGVQAAGGLAQEQKPGLLGQCYLLGLAAGELRHGTQHIVLQTHPGDNLPGDLPVLRRYVPGNIGPEAFVLYIPFV